MRVVVGEVDGGQCVGHVEAETDIGKPTIYGELERKDYDEKSIVNEED